MWMPGSAGPGRGWCLCVLPLCARWPGEAPRLDSAALPPGQAAVLLPTAVCDPFPPSPNTHTNSPPSSSPHAHLSPPSPTAAAGLRLPPRAGMAVFDTMRHIRPDVSTVCVGLAASMGAFLLASGHQGKRYSLPNSRWGVGEGWGVENRVICVSILCHFMSRLASGHEGMPFLLPTCCQPLQGFYCRRARDTPPPLPPPCAGS